MATRRRSSNRTITGTVSDLQRRVRYLQAATPPTRLATQVVARTNVSPRAINSDQLELAAVTNDQVAADAVALANMQNNSVGEGQIVDGSVSNAKVADDAIATGNLQNSSVTEDKIGNSSVTTNKVSNLAITTGKLADASVNDTKITSNAVTEDKIRNGAVGRTKIQDRAVGNGQLADSAVGRTKIQDRAVGNGQLADSSVSSGKIGNGQVTNSKIGGTVSGGKIGSGINGDNINARSINSTKIADKTLSDGQIANSYGAIAVSKGLNPGFGINKRGNTVELRRSVLNAYTPRSTFDRHRHEYQAFTGPADTSRPVFSSARVKKNIATHKTVDPKNLTKLELKKFKYKRSHSGYHHSSNREWAHGYIIEDLLSLGFDEAVHYNKKGEPEKLDYGLMSALVLELVKVQQKEIESLQEKVTKLEKK